MRSIWGTLSLLDFWFCHAIRPMGPMRVWGIRLPGGTALDHRWGLAVLGARFEGEVHGASMVLLISITGGG